MKAATKEKRKVAAIAPYRWRGDALEYFLQKRDDSAPMMPGMFGLFGGGIEEGETPEEAIVRELKEELTVDLEGHVYFSRYEHAEVVLEQFMLEVGDTFEDDVVVQEGEYGRFMTLAEMEENPKVGRLTLLIIAQIQSALTGAKL